MRNRVELAKYLNDQGYRKGAEVGVFAGYYSKVLLENIPELKLLAVDNWEGSWGRSRDDAYKALGNNPQVRIIEKSSVEAASQVPDDSLDFVYIDAAHDYEHVKQDIEAWYPKVRAGGVLCGDDYYHMRSGNTGVIDAVDEFVAENGINLQVTDWDDKNPVEDDRQPNWWVIKP